MKRSWAFAPIGALVATFFGVTVSCSRSVDPVPLRTFERAQKLDVVCMHVRDQAGNLVMPPEPRPESACSAVPPGVIGDALPNHLFALVTQTLRGEVAVVDLTAGRIVDTDYSTPGVNFLPVGKLPADVASAPDGKLVFVATAEPNKSAIYALPTAPPAANSRDSHGIFGDEYEQAIPKITDWPVCALPETPSSQAIVQVGESPTSPYVVSAVIPGAGRTPTKVAIIDPVPFLRGAKLDATPGTIVAPGSLAPCPILTAVSLTESVPDSVSEGATWPSGIPFADVSADLPLPEGATCAAPASSTDAGAGDGGSSDGGTTSSSDAGVIAMPKLPGDTPRAVSVVRDGTTLYLADEALPIIHVLDLSSPTQPRERQPLVATSIANPTRRVSVGPMAVSPSTRDYKRYLYAVDRQDGSLMVFDVTDVGRGPYPRVPMKRPHPELNPFQPSDRIAFSTPITSVAFVRHDWPVTSDNGQPLTVAPTGLLCNPNVNANAVQSPTASVEQPFRDPGALYRANQTAIEVALGPARLRGVFAFATLASGQMAIIDVDDWDAPCRRPDPMGIRTGPNGTEADGKDASLVPPIFSSATGGRTRGVNDLTPLMPGATSGDDLDPWHAPAAYYQTSSFTTGVTNEAFFPVSAPHRPRSLYFLRRDPATGIHIPYLGGLPQLRSKGSPINTVGPNAIKNPSMLPTFTDLPDPGQVTSSTDPNPRARTLSKEQSLLDEAHLPIQTSTADIRLAWEDPLVHVDQDWTLTYEGALPGYDKLSASFESVARGDHTAGVLRVPNGLLCSRGVSDQRESASRAAALAEVYAEGAVQDGAPLLVAPKRLDHKLGDYVQLIDEIVPADDPYWSAPEPDAADRCWDDSLSTPASRYDLCSRTFQAAANEPTSRDFPILEAYDDQLVIGTYGYEDPQNPRTDNREVRARGDVNAPFIKLARCCFHRQVHFRVRAGAEWVAVGSVSGFLHSMTRGAGGRCEPSCSPDDALLQGRAPAVPRVKDLDLPATLASNATPAEKQAFDEATLRVTRRRQALTAFLGRNSALAMRNPMFSVVMWNALDAVGPAGTDVPPARDLEWLVQARGQFVPLTIPLAGRTTSIAPQVIRYIGSIRQLAVVDGSLQGLEVFDVRTLAAAHDPYL